MTAPATSVLTPAWRATLSALAFHTILGASLPYLPVWMEEARGMSGAEIAGAATLATLARLVAGPLTADFASRKGLRATLTVLMLFAAALFVALVPHHPRAVTFGLVLCAYAALGVTGPLFEALLVHSTKTGWPDYGLGRAIGSSGFILANLGAGALIGAYGPEWLLAWLVSGCALAAVAAHLAPSGARSVLPRRSLAAVFRDGIGLYADRRILLASVAAALIQASHGQYYNFGSVIWLAAGVPGAQIGLLWSIGVMAEIALLIFSARLLAGISPAVLIVIGGAGAALRWTLAGFLPPLEALYVIQTLHACSFAFTHLGIIRFLADELPDDRIALAYSVNGALLFGPAIALSGFAAGLIYDALAAQGVASQARGYWLMAGLAGAGALAALRLRRGGASPDAVSA